MGWKGKKKNQKPKPDPAIRGEPKDIYRCPNECGELQHELGCSFYQRKSAQWGQCENKKSN
jgi:hypothetical protein